MEIQPRIADQTQLQKPVEDIVKSSHPYHYSLEKNLVQRFIDWLAPVGLFLLYFIFFGNGLISSYGMIKITGLTSIALLAITLVAGPICRFIPQLNSFKAHRKFWGIASLLIAMMHGGLFLVFDQITPSRVPGLIAALWAVLVLLLVITSSNHYVLQQLPPGLWKKIQNMSYVALLLGVIHFYLAEQIDGVFSVTSIFEKATFWFATFALVLRIIVYFFPKKIQHEDQ